MFKKLEFNNLVITNKKIIQQARAQIISKFVQRLRKIKASLTKQPDNEKHKERLRKNVECVAQLKLFKCAEIMRRLLLQAGSNHNAVITNGRATPEEVALAMLALNKIMQQLIAKFQKSLKLSEKADASWREEILETSKRKAKLERTEEKKRKRKELKEQKAQSRNREEWLAQNQVEINDANDTVAGEVPETTSQVFTVDEMKDAEAEKSVKPDKCNSKTRKECAQDKLTKIKVKKEERVNKLKLKNKKINLVDKELKKKTNKNDKKMKAPKDFVKKEERVNESSLQNENHNLSDTKSKTQVKHNIKTVKTEEERPTHVADPFFFTETGEHYMSTAVVLPGDSGSESEEEANPFHRRAGKQRQNAEYKRTVEADKLFNQKRRFPAAESSTDLHPSWLAKQQKKPIISNFKGKKIKFGDDGSAAEILVASTTTATSQAQPNESEGMHPSWIAKQKLKPKIATFTGTKIKFDDD